MANASSSKPAFIQVADAGASSNPAWIAGQLDAGPSTEPAFLYGQSVDQRSSVPAYLAGANPPRALFLYRNVGVARPDLKTEERALYLLENVGLQALADPKTKPRALYQVEAVTDDPPYPYLESLDPTFGPPTTAVQLEVDGCGDSPGQYGGEVQLNGIAIGVTQWVNRGTITAVIPAGVTSGLIRIKLSTPDPPGVRYSEEKFFEVTAPALTPGVGFEIKVYDRNNTSTLLDLLDGAI